MANRVDVIQADVMARLKQEVAEYERKNTSTVEGKKFVNRPPGAWVEKRARALLDTDKLAEAFAADAVDALLKPVKE